MVTMAKTVYARVNALSQYNTREAFRSVYSCIPRVHRVHNIITTEN